ncbi:formimidoylglutamase [Corynebacterium epidermidicanis]|uniref:Formimidoylglutamase n=1 Tax=Corynebacterium epidermidicanis TaxID=1050174 RepID=A0A0G3GR75_9CORY|nr:formimidoylglutamase [Corynebacterium epidermidicanis]AKK03671.1 formiminoglutamase [Corynebacterium epidermidicanis]
MKENMSAWAGRVDGSGKEHARWNSVIQPIGFDARYPGVAVLGFASDEGVRRNHGRVGAATAPDVIRSALGGLAIHHEFPLYDVGTVTVRGEDLEGGHAFLSDAVQEILGGGHVAVVLGGGHETAFGTHMGLRAALPDAEIGIINLDAHFDLRTADRPSSGTPFKQIADAVGRDLNYSVFGISRPNNTRILFDTADYLGVRYTLDDELAELKPAEAAELIRETAEKVDYLHLSIDLDVLPAAVAPGVSAPAAVGVELATIRAMARAAAATGKLKLVDVVELNPKYDIDNRTAKVAARLVDDIVAELAKRAS